VPRHEEEDFRALIADLARDHELIGYSRAVNLIRHGPIERPTVALSFDDGFASNIRAAAILEEFGATGMFFVPPGFIGTPTVRQAQAFYGSAVVNEPAMTWKDLEQLKERGHEIGNHTWGHRALTLISNEEMRDEIGRGADELRKRLGECDHFAWPLGRFAHFTAVAARTVFATGHSSCASAERGAHSVANADAPELLCLRRDHIMTEWPLRHCRYFIGRAGLRNDTYGRWPDGWDVPL
jgi:peptidoglycan/xylan/chitin deacetylase (PgdA/CDA1 family)